MDERTIEAVIATHICNWAGNLTYRATALHQPESTEALQELVARLPHVKAVGTRHSFSDVADSPDGVLVSLTRIPAEIDVDQERGGSVSPATTYGAFATELHRLGWALPNMGSLPHISVGGATATATHGSGDTNQVLSASVRSLDLVVADGSIVTIDRSSPDLAGVAVGLGAFGIVTRLTMDVQPTFDMRQDLYVGVPWATALASFDDLMASAYSVSLIGDLGRREITATIQKSVVSGTQPVPAPVTLYGGSWDDDSHVADHDTHTARGGVVGPWHERLPHFRPDRPPSAGGDELQSEYFVARRHGVDALDALLSMGDQISPHLHAAEIRTVAGDDLWMSPAYQRPSVCIGFTWKKHVEEVAALLPLVEAALEPFEPRPHWGKLFSFGDLHRRFPGLGAFLDLRDRYDPTGTFDSDFIRRLRP